MVVDPGFGWKTGECVVCNQTKSVGTPYIFAYPARAGERAQRWLIESLKDRCEDCLKSIGLGRKQIVVPVGECMPAIKAVETELERIRPLVAENQRRLEELMNPPT